GPYAAYSGVTSNVTIAAGTRVYLIDGATKPPSFVLDDLKLLNLSGEVSVTDLKALAAASRHTMPPANQVYGVDYSWTGRLSPAQFPEGLYAVLVTIREQTLNKRGTLLIPLMVDRTPPELEVKSVSMEPPVVSPQLSLPLTWSLSDHYSAVMNNVYLTYQALGGSVTTGTVFVAGTKALAGGERRLDFAPDFSSVPLGTEQVYTLQIHASDVPGNRGVSSNFTFLVDTKPPTIDSLFVYPSMTGGAYNSILNRSNHTLTTRVVCSEPFTGRFMLVDANNTTNLWFATSTTNSADPSKHQAVWVLDLPPADPKQGMLNGVVADGVHRLSIQLVDRARNTNTYMNVKTIMVDREPPVVAFRSQPAFIPANRTVYPLDVDTNGFTADDQITSIALANLNYFAPTSAVPYHTITSWTGSQISGVMASGIPLAGQPAGYYGVEIKARDSAGNETRVATQFGYQFMLPHVEAVGAPNLAGIVPIVGIAVDPYPADRFPFRSRELYWTLGSNVAAPTNLAAINPGIWKTAGFYVLPPRGTAFAAQDNASGEMVASGTLGYWNSTSAGLAFQGDAQTTIPGAGIVDSDVTLLLVVRDQGGQTWAHAATVHVDNRQTDTTALTIPGVQVAGASVTGQQLQLDTALLRDTPSLQMVVMDATGNAVYRTTRANVESKNKLFGRPTYSLEKDFGYFAWYDQAAGQLRVRCVSPERDSQGGSLSKGHTFYFSLLGSFGTNDLAYYQLS
ncbi:MAG: hypothetical protein NT154_08420, partial [Verrucomicrobia bacterium]|nr:hypothetical protein [Verrucomicrobiota bacterium]